MPAVPAGGRSGKVTPLPVRSGRRGAVARQRRVLAILLGALFIPALAGLVTGSAVAWWVFVALLPVVCAYLAVLLRARRLMAEREMSIAFFGSTDAPVTTLQDVFATGEGAALSRRRYG